jgi:hypothetical protein
VTVVDPFHPLCGRTFRVAAQHRSPREPRSFEVEHRDGIILRIPAAATDAAYCLSPSTRTRITADAVRQVLGLVADWREPCESRLAPSGSEPRKRSDDPSGKPS